MTAVAWEITHSVETNASPDFAWHYWTNVANWDDPPARFELDAPFATGSRGVTQLPGQQPLRWLIREVSDGMNKLAKAMANADPSRKIPV